MPRFPTKILQIWLDRINITTQKKIIFRTEFILNNQKTPDNINPKYLKKEREKNLKFPQEWAEK